MGAAAEDVNRRMLRAKDLMDRRYADPLDVAAVARVAHVSPAHFARTFRQVFGESPHRYLQRRRVELGMEVAAEHARLEAAGVDVDDEPVVQPYGTDFGLRDPFGNHVRIAQPNGAPA